MRIFHISYSWGTEHVQYQIPVIINVVSRQMANGTDSFQNVWLGVWTVEESPVSYM
jgi:hypothetical protein